MPILRNQQGSTRQVGSVKEKYRELITCNCVLYEEVQKLFCFYYESNLKQFIRVPKEINIGKYIQLVKLSCLVTEFRDKLGQNKYPPLLSHNANDQARFAEAHA